MFLIKCLYVIIFLLKIITTNKIEKCTLSRDETGSCVQIEHCSFGVRNGHANSTRLKLKIAKLKELCAIEDTACCPDRHLMLPENIEEYILHSRFEESDNNFCTHKSIKLLQSCYLPSMNKISFGNKTNEHEFPFMALIGYRVNQKIDFLCGGTLITERYVLTAGHCSHFPDLEIVRLGEHNLEESSKAAIDIPVQQIIDHPKYNENQIGMYDISLLRLRKPAILNQNSIATVCLPITKSIRESTLTTAIINGWGRTEANDKFSNIPFNAKVTLHSIDKCEQLFGIQLNYSPLLCGKGDNKVSTCGGDSGGPIFEMVETDNCQNKPIFPKYVQFGIISAGLFSCGDVSGYTVFTDLNKHMQWILDSLEP